MSEFAVLRLRRYAFIPLLLAFWISGCTGSGEVLTPGHTSDIQYIVIGVDLPEDEVMAAQLAPYRVELNAMMNEVVAVAAFEITKFDGRYESSLGNLASEAMLEEAMLVTGEQLDLAVGNAGGLRVPLAEGEVTLGNVFELMPFENYLVVQTLSGVQVDSLAQQLARENGEPVAGIRFAITADNRAVEIEVGGEPLDHDRLYRVVTHNYLAYGGGDMSVLWEPLDVQDLPVMLRDAFVNHFRRLGTLNPHLDGRIREATP